LSRFVLNGCADTHLAIASIGFIDPKEEAASTKTLCAELLRGTGAVLLDRQGRRFVNELGTRDHISAEMMARDPQVHTVAPFAAPPLLVAARMRAAVRAMHVENSTSERTARLRAGGVGGNLPAQALDFVILLTAEQAALADKHVPMYVNKGLLNHFSTLDDLTAWMRALPSPIASIFTLPRTRHCAQKPDLRALPEALTLIRRG
jgi:hypothetical protein